MSFQCEQKIKSDILTALGSDQLFCLLGDRDVNVLMKTLGLLRNLLSSSCPDHRLVRWHVNVSMYIVCILDHVFCTCN